VREAIPIPLAAFCSTETTTAHNRDEPEPARASMDESDTHEVRVRLVLPRRDWLVASTPVAPNELPVRVSI
jgi:hypothetical protein